jgi:Ni/Fe-hydrogenase subunit HybB-like protein
MGQKHCTAILAALLGMGLILSAFPMLAHACAVCGGAEDNGYFWGVLFLMSMPFTVGGLIGGWLLYSYRRTQHVPLTSVLTPTVAQHMPRRPSTAVASGGDDRPQTDQA